MAISDLKVWKPNTFFAKGENIQWAGVAYEVLAPHTTRNFFDKTSSYYSVIFGSGGGGGSDGRGITTALVNPDGDLIITYTDATTENAGHVVGADGGDNIQIERLIVTGPTSLSLTTQGINNSKPVKLTINHTVYSSVETPPPFTCFNTAITWDATAGGFNLSVNDSVFVEYYIESTPA